MIKDLHVGTSLEELNCVAHKNFKKFKRDKLYNSAEKLFETGLGLFHDGDEEMAYILFIRFLCIYDYLSKIDDDYTRKRLGHEYNTVVKLHEKIKNSLGKRYSDQQKIKGISTITVETPTPKLTEMKDIIHFPSGYVSCADLFRLLEKKCDIIVFDVRPAEDFKSSGMKYPCCVNIPEDLIKSGMSANVLGKEIPEGSRSQWNRRHNVALVILVDWSSSRDTLTVSKLHVLNDILVNWDPSMSSSHAPVVLEGGYLDWLQTYPMLCTNPHVVHQVQNTVLNELLDLDTIEYPHAEEPLPSIVKKCQQLPFVDRATKPISYNDAVNTLKKSIIHGNTELENKRLEYERDLELLRHSRQLEAEESMRQELQLREEKLIEDKKWLEKSQEELNNKNEELQKQLESLRINEKPNIVKKEEVTLSNDNLDTREKLLLDARGKKKPVMGDKILTSDLKRKISPYNVENEKVYDKKFPSGHKRVKLTPSPKPSVTEPGITGLKNFGTTCYMNSVVQCLSNTQKIATYFCNTDYLSELNKNQGTCGHIASVFGSVIQTLWSGECRYLLPKQLKAAVSEYAPRYKTREHQDAHEFLITLTNWIHEDLKKDLLRPIQSALTPKEKNWVEQTEGKCSVIVDTFCGQMRAVITCEACGKQKEKYEIFQNLTLSLPPGDHCTLEKCLRLHFEKQPIIGYRCPKCKKDQHVFQQMQLAAYPHVMVICLKRFCEEFYDNSILFKKNTMAVSFPTERLRLHNFTYSLYGVVNHRGELEHGHYTAVCKNIITEKWYKYDDETVTEVNKDIALSPNEVYMLFYQVNEEK